MLDWFREQIWNAYGLQDIDPEMTGEWSWAGMPQQWIFTVILFAVGVGCWLIWRSYRREGVFASPLTKAMLAIVRCTLLVLAFAFFLQPMWLARQTPKEERGL